MNAFFTMLDSDIDGADGSLLVSEWNDEVQFVIRDKHDRLLARFWVGADQAAAITAVLQSVFGFKVDK